MPFPRTFSKSSDPYLRDHEIEGTPFVPMAVMVSEIIERLPPGVEGLSKFEVNAPIMLRKGRIRETVLRLSDGPLAFLDAAGNVLASGLPMVSGSPEEKRFTSKFSFAFESPDDWEDEEEGQPGEAGPDQTGEAGAGHLLRGGKNALEGMAVPPNWPDLAGMAGIWISPERNVPGATETAARNAGADGGEPRYNPDELFLPRETLYPDLFFHGPTLQADFTIIDIDDGAMSITLSGLSDPVTDSLWSPWSAPLGLRRTNPIVLDLALQCAALEAMLTCGSFMLPRGFNGIFFVDEVFPHMRTCRVLLCQDGEGGYDCVVTGQGEKPCMIIEGLNFAPVGREIPPAATGILTRIRDHFDLGSLETMH